MTACLGKSCSFGLLCVFFFFFFRERLSVCVFASFPFGFEQLSMKFEILIISLSVCVLASFPFGFEQLSMKFEILVSIKI